MLDGSMTIPLSLRLVVTVYNDGNIAYLLADEANFRQANGRPSQHILDLRDRPII